MEDSPASLPPAQMRIKVNENGNLIWIKDMQDKILWQKPPTIEEKIRKDAFSRESLDYLLMLYNFAGMRIH